MRFQDPLWLLAFIFLVGVFYLRQKKYRSTILFSDVKSLKEISTNKGIVFKLKEFYKMYSFFTEYFKYNEN